MSKYIKFANELADASGKVIKEYFRSKMDVEDKLDKSPVTIADKLVESVLRRMISKKFPKHEILGEEFENFSTNSKWKWVLDPIDGTRSFILGYPIFGTLISLVENNVNPILGIIDIPATGERWFGYKDKESIFFPDNNSEKSIKCKVSDQKKIEKAVLTCADPVMFDVFQKKKFDDLASKVKMVRWGGDCYSYGLLALGFIDLVVEADLKIFDVMALIPVVEEAGGIISDWQGQVIFNDDWDGCVLASANRELHEKALQYLN